MTKRLASRLAAVAAATLIGLTGAAFAKPFHHGHGAGGDVVMSIMRLKSQLNLNTSQQTMWDNAAAAGKAARVTARTNMQKVHDTPDPSPTLPRFRLHRTVRAMRTRHCMRRCATRGSTSTRRSRPSRRAS